MPRKEKIKFPTFSLPIHLFIIIFFIKTCYMESTS
jgi:hypothetical protein